ncbi:efflux RND transporter periplasmic adaptor subunit [Haliea sp. E1-2-M8]|uniref:efflux RND transporter periplasmic adaptor subunit n=1 Tax=Haliea sp. E1-2-M8 TaxID=3064706 RepID=UPI00271B8D65|nr:efflux RND transporter periplasmic adaptor subunit [Haliea sp. E1-2-M8]MDO8862021.1 efflux RND transporter periplasmic adaptor subunit [Haliea sp. E1-2-M8]
MSVAIVETGEAVQYGEYAARVRSPGAVELRAQVGGVLKQRLYQEGQRIQKGEALFQIDPEPYVLALRQTEAELAEARAEHANSERESRRQQDLFARQVSSEHDKDRATTALQAALARLQKAEAAESDAKRLLRYAQVEAPVAGIVGLEALAAGNLVEAGTLLTTITPLDPIHVHFTLPARDAATRRVALADGAGGPAETGLLLDRGQAFPYSGQLNFTDARIDPRTDSIHMRAVFPNPQGELLPGQFVRLQLPLRVFRDVVLIDPKAVTEGPAGPQVYTVDNGTASGDQTTRARPVNLGPIVEGLQVVLTGLSAGDQLVVNGQVSLRPGSAVSVVETVPARVHMQGELARTPAQAGL